MPSEAIIFCSKEPESNDLNLAKLLDYFGVKYKFIRLGVDILNLDRLIKDFKDEDPCVLSNCKAIKTLFMNCEDHETTRSFLFDNISYLLLYNISPVHPEIKAINCLTDGIIESLSTFKSSNYQYEIHNDSRDICRQFAGLTFGPINNERDYKLGMKSGSEGIFDLICIDGHPFFIQMNLRKCRLFLVASDRILDIKRKSSSVINIQESFSQIVPEMMFIKYVFKDKCWHTDTNFASLIIDDPLLKEKYGFLDYSKLLREMDKHNFSTSIAFIPWNFKRTSSKVANMFKERPDRFTVCVHGCDHTENEFGTTDIEKLNGRIKLATRRMISHENTMGLKFDKVMIFPQGRFSTMAMQVLKANNYLAAVNSSAIPFNKSEGLETTCFFEPATMVYASFPLFLRRYPENYLDLVFDLFLGKPAFIVTHHNNFKGGYHTITDLIDKMNSVAKDIQWVGVGTAIEHSYLEKVEADGTVYCKIYANSTFIKNKHRHTRKYIVSKHETGNVPIKYLLVNGKKSSYRILNNKLTLALRISPKDVVRIELVYEDDISCVPLSQNVRDNVKVWMRRHTSEFRDNVISKNDFLLSLAYKVKKLTFTGQWGN